MIKHFLYIKKQLNKIEKYFVKFLLLRVIMEEFVVRVFTGGKVTVPKQLRELLGIQDGDYVRLALLEVLKKGDAGWVKRKVE